jgi:hypothetical protein
MVSSTVTITVATMGKLKPAISQADGAAACYGRCTIWVRKGVTDFESTE